MRNLYILAIFVFVFFSFYSSFSVSAATMTIYKGQNIVGVPGLKESDFSSCGLVNLSSSSRAGCKYNKNGYFVYYNPLSSGGDCGSRFFSTNTMTDGLGYFLYANNTCGITYTAPATVQVTLYPNSQNIISVPVETSLDNISTVCGNKTKIFSYFRSSTRPGCYYNKNGYFVYYDAGGNATGDCTSRFKSEAKMRPFVGYYVYFNGKDGDNQTSCSFKYENGVIKPSTSSTTTTTTIPTATTTIPITTTSTTTRTTTTTTRPTTTTTTTTTLPSTIFSDGFETDFNAWTGKTEGGATISVVTSPVYQGSKSAKTSGLETNGEAAYCYKDITGQPTIFMRTYFQISALPPASTNSIMILRFMGTGIIVDARIYNDNGVMKIQGGRWLNGIWTGYISSAITIPVNTWHCLELKAVISTTGEYVVYFDGVAVATVSGNTTGRGNVNQVLVGGCYLMGAWSVNVAVDSVVIANAYIGL